MKYLPSLSLVVLLVLDCVWKQRVFGRSWLCVEPL